jgi:hypothetical protein
MSTTQKKCTCFVAGDLSEPCALHPNYINEGKGIKACICGLQGRNPHCAVHTLSDTPRNPPSRPFEKEPKRETPEQENVRVHQKYLDSKLDRTKSDGKDYTLGAKGHLEWAPEVLSYEYLTGYKAGVEAALKIAGVR